MPRGPSSAGQPDDFLPGVPPWVIGVFAGILAWAGAELLVQGVGAVFWGIGVAFGVGPIPTWIRVTLGIALQLVVLAIAIDVGRRTTLRVTARRRGTGHDER